MTCTIQPVVQRYASLAAMRTAHSQLLQTYAGTGDTPRFQAEAIALITQGRATGAILEIEDERLDAQQILDHWATILYRIGIEPPDATLATFDRSALPDLSDQPCPYKGMDPFDEDDADNFFGCERLVEKLLQRLQEHRLLFLVGHSGSGKSSLVRAGLIPALKRGALPDSRSWRFLPVMVPGSDPLGSLGRLVQCLGEADQLATDVFRDERASLRQALERSRDGFPVVVVDQFEEIFALCSDQEAREAFVENLVNVIETSQPAAAIIFTLRTEFVPQVEQLATLRRHFKACQETLAPLNETELREIVALPAERVGLEFQPGVVDALVHDVAAESAPLPLLQFSLLKLWEGRDRNRVKMESYQRLGAPRVALAAAAETFYTEHDHLERKIMQGTLLRMVGFSENSIATSRPVGRAALHRMEYDATHIDEVLQKLRENHLLRIAKGHTPNDDQVEVAHEALVHNWPRLAEWIERQRGALTVRRRLDDYAAEWVRLGRDGAGLLDNIQTEEADEWLRSQHSRDLGYNDALPALVKTSREAFEERHRHDLEQAQALAEAERQRAEEQRLKAEAEHRFAEKEATSARRLRIGVAAMTALFLIAAVAGYLAIRAEQDAKRQRLRQVVQTLAIRAPSLPNDDGALLARQAYLFYQRIAARSPDRHLADQVDHGLRSVLGAPYFTHVLKADPGGVFSVAVSADGQLIAAGGRDGILRLWNVSDPSREPARVTVLSDSGGDAAIWCIAIHPSRPLLATVGAEGNGPGTLKLWTRDAGEIHPTPLPAGLATTATSVAFSPDGKFMATGGGNGAVQLWEVGSEASPLELSRPEAPTSTPLHKTEGGRMSLAFSPGSQKLAAGARDGVLCVWDLANLVSPPIALPWRRGGLTAITFCGDDQTLAAAGQDGMVLVWSLTQLEKPGLTLTGHKRSVSSLSFDAKNQLLASSSWDGTVHVRRLALPGNAGDILRSHGGGVTSVAFQADGTRLVSGGADGTVSVHEIRDRDASPTPGLPHISRAHTERVTAFSFSADGRLRAAGTLDGSVSVVDLQRPETAAVVLKGGTAAIRSVAISADLQRIAAGSANGTISVWDRTNPGQPILLFPGQEDVFSLRFNSDGTKLAAGTVDGSVRIYDSAKPSAAPLIIYGDRLRGIMSVAFIDNDTKVIEGSWDGGVRVWDLEKPEAGPQAQFQPSTASGSSVTSVAFSQSGLSMAANFADGSARLFDLRDFAAPSLNIPGGSKGITAVAHSRDGHMVAVARGDKTKQVWNPRRPEETLITLRGHQSFAIAMAFSGDGKTLTSSSTTETVWSWIGPTEALAREVCKKVWRTNFTQEEWSSLIGEGIPYEHTCPER